MFKCNYWNLIKYIRLVDVTLVRKARLFFVETSIPECSFLITTVLFRTSMFTVKHVKNNTISCFNLSKKPEYCAKNLDLSTFLSTTWTVIVARGFHFLQIYIWRRYLPGQGHMLVLNMCDLNDRVHCTCC